MKAILIILGILLVATLTGPWIFGVLSTVFNFIGNVFSFLSQIFNIFGWNTGML